MTERNGRKRARELMSKCGYGGRIGGHFRRAAGGNTDDDASDRRMVKSGVGQHEENMHPGKPRTRLRLQDGGTTEDDGAPPRQDRGRRSSRSRDRDHGSRVNILIHGGPRPGEGAGAQPGEPPGGAAPPPVTGPPSMPPAPRTPVMAPPPAMPPGMAPPGMGGLPPPGAAPPMAGPPRPMGMARGGRAGRGEIGPGTRTMSAGAGSGAGRLQKIGGSHGYQRMHPDGRPHLNYQIPHPGSSGNRLNYQRQHPFGSGRGRG